MAEAASGSGAGPDLGMEMKPTMRVPSTTTVVSETASRARIWSKVSIGAVSSGEPASVAALIRAPIRAPMSACWSV